MERAAAGRDRLRAAVSRLHRGDRVRDPPGDDLHPRAPEVDRRGVGRHPRDRRHLPALRERRALPDQRGDDVERGRWIGLHLQQQRLQPVAAREAEGAAEPVEAVPRVRECPAGDGPARVEAIQPEIVRHAIDGALAEDADGGAGADRERDRPPAVPACAEGGAGAVAQRGEPGHPRELRPAACRLRRQPHQRLVRQLGETRGRDPHRLQHLPVPPAAGDVEQARAGSHRERGAADAEEAVAQVLAEGEPAGGARKGIARRAVQPDQLRGGIALVQEAAGARVRGLCIDPLAEPRGILPRPRIAPAEERRHRPAVRADAHHPVPEGVDGDGRDLRVGGARGIHRAVDRTQRGGDERVRIAFHRAAAGSPAHGDARERLGCDRITPRVVQLSADGGGAGVERQHPRAGGRGGGRHGAGNLPPTGKGPKTPLGECGERP